jgi:hypothetical protein
MAGYSFGEQVDITFTYGRANGGGRDAARRYHGNFPERKLPNHQIFAAVYRRLAETETLALVSADRDGAIVSRAAGLEERMLKHVAVDTVIGMRQLAVAFPVGYMTV